VKAIVNAVTAPVPTVVANAVTTTNVIWAAPSPTARGAINSNALRAAGSAVSARGVYWNPMALDEQVSQGAEHHAHRQPDHPEGGGQQQRRADDREVVHDRGDGGGGEPAARVEDARRDGTQREEDRAQDHDPRQLDGQGHRGRVEPARVQRHEAVGEDEHEQGEYEERAEHQRRDRRDDPPCPGRPVRGDDGGHHRDERR
jgi:hypothetical protein